eukprot:scaffold10986_cov91-Cylindrotheca_fusiformis.AAC.2
MPKLPEDDEVVSGLLFNDSRLGSVADDADDLVHRLKHRFVNSPLNKLCYYQSYHAPEDAMVHLRLLMDDNPLAASCQVDEFGMTPLHVLSLAQTPNIDMLLALMDKGNADHIIHGRDSFGKTPMDYLCLNRMPNSTQVIRRVICSRFDYLLGLDRWWESDVLHAIDEALAVDFSARKREMWEADMLQAIEEALAVDCSPRRMEDSLESLKRRETARREIVAIYFKLAKYELKIVLSLLEIRLWQNSGGASVVIPNVLPFLDTFDIKDYFAHSTLFKD